MPETKQCFYGAFCEIRLQGHCVHLLLHTRDRGGSSYYMQGLNKGDAQLSRKTTGQGSVLWHNWHAGETAWKVFAVGEIRWLSKGCDNILCK